MAIDDGGPAFPQIRGGHVEESRGAGHNNLRVTSEDGMSLRDYFAAQVLPETYRQAQADAAGLAWEKFLAAIARTAYQLADAMLAEREK